jgi:hypothetical protein
MTYMINDDLNNNLWYIISDQVWTAAFDMLSIDIITYELKTLLPFYVAE